MVLTKSINVVYQVIMYMTTIIYRHMLDTVFDAVQLPPPPPTRAGGGGGRDRERGGVIPPPQKSIYVVYRIVM
jgi:hypothetical protein